MKNLVLFNKTGRLISNSVYESAIELLDTWDEYVRDNWQESEDFDRSNFYESDGTPSIDKIVEVIGAVFMWPKMDQYPEDVIGVDCTEEEEECYDKMTDEEIRRFVDEGIRRFEKEKKKRPC